MFPALFLAFALTSSPVQELSIRPTPARPEAIAWDELSPLPVDTAARSPRMWVVTLLAPECPLSRQHVYTLNQLRVDFSAQGIAFVGLFPQSESTSAERETFRQETGAAFALAGDSARAWTRGLGGTITPEVFVVREDGVIVYSGALDDWAVSLGQKRRAATRHYVREALEAAQSGLLPTTRRVEPVGCRIE